MTHNKNTMKIKAIKAKQVLTSTGKPTIEVSLETDNGVFFTSVPFGISAGKQEAVDLPAQQAIQNIEKIIAPAIVGKNFKSQKKLDKFLIGVDGTKNKSRLGGNAILAVSVAFLRGLAYDNKMPLWKYIAKIAKIKPGLPKPLMLLIEGGKHGKGRLAFQEFLFAPDGATFSEQFQTGKETYNNVREALTEKETGAEGAFTPNISEQEALSVIVKASQGKGAIALDIAASSFYQEGNYNFQGKQLTGEQMGEVYSGLAQKYPIISLEDPFSEDDLASWRQLMMQSGKGRPSLLQKGRSALPRLPLLVVGDDLLCTNSKRIKMAYKQKLCNAVIIKPNQIGTVSETIEAFKLAKKYNWTTIVSHRAGETEDSFIADLSTGFATDFIKAGGLAQPERLAKYNRLLAIEKEFC